MEDVERVRRSQSGDRGAFEELIRATARLVWASVYGQVRDPAWTEDIVQETYLKAWASIGELKEPEAFRGWLLTIARRMSWRHAELAGRPLPPDGLALYAGLGLSSLATGLSGDEPHYLIITHSLLVDRDLKIENNHVRSDYRWFWRADLRPDYFVRGRNGEIYSIHSPGLSALVLPGYAIAGAGGAVVTMCLFGALAALAIYDVAFLLGGSAIALLTWLSVCLTVPFVPHSWMLYPEMAGAAIVAWAVRWLLEEDPAGAPAEEPGVVQAAHEVRRAPRRPRVALPLASAEASPGDGGIRGGDRVVVAGLAGLFLRHLREH